MLLDFETLGARISLLNDFEAALNELHFVRVDVRIGVVHSRVVILRTNGIATRLFALSRLIQYQFRLRQELMNFLILQACIPWIIFSCQDPLFEPIFPRNRDRRYQCLALLQIEQSWPKKKKVKSLPGVTQMSHFRES